MNKKNIIVLLVLSISLLSGIFSEWHVKRKVYYENNGYIYGLTIDDSWYGKVNTSKVIKKFKRLKKKNKFSKNITFRIVMSKDRKPEKYVKLFKAVKSIGHIMATPVDSSEMITYKSVKSYEKRFSDSYKHLKDYVDIWEIGNEINGENWLGKDEQFIADKMFAAYSLIKGEGGKTALTSYYTKPGLQKREMSNWLEKYVPENMKNDLDYVFVSYYEDDNEGYNPGWKAVFSQLEKQFPNSKLGIGECGCTKEKATKKQKQKRYNYYYNMPKYVGNYVGGYFWWYAVQDFVIKKDLKF